MRKALVLLILVVVGCGIAFWYAGRLPGPTIVVDKPKNVAGAVTPVEVSVTVPDGRIRSVQVLFDQNGKSTSLVSVPPTDVVALKPDGSGTVRIATQISKEKIPDL